MNRISHAPTITILVRMKGFELLRHLRHLALSRACLPFHHIRVVPEEGFEPSRSKEHSDLNAACLPFHHPGLALQGITPLRRLCKSPVRAHRYKLVVRDVGLEPTRPKTLDLKSSAASVSPIPHQTKSPPITRRASILTNLMASAHEASPFQQIAGRCKAIGDD